MKLQFLKTTLFLFMSISLFSSCDSDDDGSSSVNLLDVVWTAEDESGAATIIFRTDNTWTSTNTVTNESLNGEWSWVDQGNRIMKYGEFEFFGDTFSEFYRFSNVTDSAMDVEFTTSPNPIQPNNNSSFTNLGTWTR